MMSKSTLFEILEKVNGLDGIMNVYKDAIQKVTLDGPTNFQPTIKRATEIAEKMFAESRTYTILLMITDGLIYDMKATIDAIVEASDKPLSIIIIGVGSDEFDSMDVLDADDKPLKSSHGTYMKRDIVQFVPFNKFKKCSSDGLEREVLTEIPRQVHEFCSTHGLIPKIQKNDIIY